MELLAFIAAALVVLGAPALAAVSWRRSLDARADSVEIVALAYGALAVAALSIWLGAELAGLSWRVALLAALAGAALLFAPAAVRAAVAQRERVVDSEPDELTGLYDGRVVPEVVGSADAGAPLLRFDAPPPNRHFGALALAGGAFALLTWIPLLTYGWQRADGIHRMAMTDWYKHLVTTTALAAGADAFPPANPFLHAAGEAPYYYGFHLVAAAIARLTAAVTGQGAGDAVYPALLLLTLATAAATPFVAYTAARTIAAGRRGGVGETASVPLLAALGATFLAGFDLVPLALDTLVNLARGALQAGGVAALRAAVPSTHLDYWIHHNERQFNAPYLTTAWAPQHMAAVLVALLAVHLVLARRLLTERSEGSAARGPGWLLPALLLAGLPALSAYVALALAVGVAGAAAVECVRGRCMLWHTVSWRLWLLPGLAAGALGLPVVALLAAGDGGAGLTIHVSDAGGWVNGALATALLGPGWLSGVLDSVALYAVELGILGLLAVLELRRLAQRKRLQAHQQHVVWLVVVVLVVVVFVRPPVGGPNNLYARSLVLAWFLLAPFAAMRYARISGAVRRAGGGAEGHGPTTSRARRPHGRRARRWMRAGTALCLLATGYAFIGVVLEGALFWAAPPATVEAARWVNDNAPAGAVVAVAPQDYSTAFGYWLRRPLALADERHALLFGATEESFGRIADALENARRASTAEPVLDALQLAGANVFLLARDGGADPPWLASPCFEAPFRNDAWLVAVQVPGGDCRR